jgi:hypothetical protein
MLITPTITCPRIRLFKQPLRNEIAFKPDAVTEAATRADFAYKIRPNTISIADATLGKLSGTKDMEERRRESKWWPWAECNTTVHRVVRNR